MLMYTRHHTRRVPGEPGSAKRRRSNRGHAITAAAARACAPHALPLESYAGVQQLPANTFHSVSPHELPVCPSARATWFEDENYTI